MSNSPTPGRPALTRPRTSPSSTATSSAPAARSSRFRRPSACPPPRPCNGHTTVIEVNTIDAPDIVGVDTGWVAVPTTYTPLPNVDQTDVFIAVGGLVSGPISHFSYCRTRDIAPTLTPGIVVTDMWQNTPTFRRSSTAIPLRPPGPPPTRYRSASRSATRPRRRCQRPGDHKSLGVRPARPRDGADAALEAFDFTDGNGVFEGVHCDSTGDSTDFITPCDPVNVNVSFPLGFPRTRRHGDHPLQGGRRQQPTQRQRRGGGFLRRHRILRRRLYLPRAHAGRHRRWNPLGQDGPFVGVQGTDFQGIYPTMKAATDPQGNSYTIRDFLAPIGQQ